MGTMGSNALNTDDIRRFQITLPRLRRQQSMSVHICTPSVSPITPGSAGTKTGEVDARNPKTRTPRNWIRRPAPIEPTCIYILHSAREAPQAPESWRINLRVMQYRPIATRSTDAWLPDRCAPMVIDAELHGKWRGTASDTGNSKRDFR
jgi:hypothetical protein